jgi:hypothetical protein
MKTCSQCAEQVQPDAVVCRHCGHRFTEDAGSKAGFLLFLGAIVAVIVFISRAVSPEAPKAPVKQEVAKPSPQGPSEFAVKTMARRRIEAALRDPSSAEYRNEAVPPGAGYLCGEVNSANGLGGKTGFQRFVAGASSQMPVAIEEQMDAAEFDEAWRRLC